MLIQYAIQYLIGRLGLAIIALTMMLGGSIPSAAEDAVSANTLPAAVMQSVDMSSSTGTDAEPAPQAEAAAPTALNAVVDSAASAPTQDQDVSAAAAPEVQEETAAPLPAPDALPAATTTPAAADAANADDVHAKTAVPAAPAAPEQRRAETAVEAPVTGPVPAARPGDSDITPANTTAATAATAPVETPLAVSLAAPAMPAVVEPAPARDVTLTPAAASVPAVGELSRAARAALHKQVPRSAPATAPAAAAQRPLLHEVKLEAPTQTGASQAVTRSLTLDVNKSRIIRLARPARDVMVANPAIADIVLRSPEIAFVVGRKIGETSVYFFDAEGHEIDGVDLTVKFDSAAVTAVLHQMIPNEDIGIATANQSLVLTGTVASAQEAENARQIARQFVADDNSIINMLSVRDKSQVLLRVRVSEMSRQVVKELGITPGSPPFNFHIGGSRFTLSGNQPTFSSTPFAALNAAIPLSGATAFTGLLQALESNGLVKTLAEPNLTAVSGETASFLVGGQFPVPSPQPSSSPGAASTITVVYKDFGVRLTFTPIVLSSGHINLKIATEVSQLSTQGQITITGFTIPALTVRRATTTVELPSGGSIAIAGLLQNDIQNTIQGFPGLKDIPILGSLFSSTQFQRNESDLVIAVTPLLVRPVDPNVLALPTDGFGPASDFNMYFLGRLNATYGKPSPEFPRGQPKGPFGYILE